MRPTGVTILSLLFIILGIFSLVGGAGMLVMLEDFKSVYPMIKERVKEFDETITPEIFENVLKVTAILMVASGIISIVIGWGLWNLFNWARIAAIIFSGFGVLSGLISTFAQPYFAFEVVINLLIIWYLMRADVMQAFGKKRSIEEEILGDDFT